MVASLNGIRFDQIYGDNSGGAEFDTDGDGTTSQEDEFVSFTNTTGAPIDVSGWQIWTDSTGSGPYGNAQEDGLYHTFPPGTVIEAGKTFYVVTEYTGTTPSNFQEASTGGSESATVTTNRLSEGAPSGTSDSDYESIALVDPATGDFLVFNMNSGAPSRFSEFDGGGTSSNPDLSGFPGDTMIAEIDGGSVQEDMNAGSSYQYNSGTDSYTYSSVFVSCLASGTHIATPSGWRAVETLREGDELSTLDGSTCPVRLILTRTIRFDAGRNAKHRPVLFAPGSLGTSRPERELTLSPQHRVLVPLPDGSEVLCPAKGLLHLKGVRRKNGLRSIAYFHLVLDRHEVLIANGAPVESFFLGTYGARRLDTRTRIALEELGLDRALAHPVRPLIGAGAYRRQMAQPTWSGL